MPLANGGQLPHELQKTTQLGYDLIKTYVRLDDRLQKQVIDFAHANGLPVTSHEIYPAVASGADGVEHIRGTSRRGYSPKVTALNRSYQDVIDLLTASKMTITPTIGITAAHSRWCWRAIRRASTTRGSARCFRRRSCATMERQAKSIAPADFDRLVSGCAARWATLVRRVVKGGGIVIAGTDSPIFPYAARVSHRAEICSRRAD